jgi:hypothetical protein
MAELHMTESDLARDLKAVLAKVRQGAQVVVEEDSLPIAIIKPPDNPNRTISESIKLAEQREAEHGPAILDPDFAADLADIVRSRRPWIPQSQD